MSKKNTALRWGSALGTAALTAGALWSQAADAALGNCTAVIATNARAWTIVPRPVVGPGAVVAFKEEIISVGFRLTGEVQHRFGLTGYYTRGAAPVGGIVPLRQPAGTGLRVTYVGRGDGNNGAWWWDGLNYVLGNSSQPPLVDNFGLAMTNGNHSIDLRYLVEVVVTNPAVYRGGQPRRDETAIRVGLQGRPNDECQGLSLETPAFSEGSSVPLLRPGVQLGCSWDVGSLTQTVALSPVAPDAVAQFGSTRAAGAQGQAQFSLRAVDCSSNTTLRVFFTDVSNQNNLGTVLGLTTTDGRREELGLRLYAGASGNPVQFGPPPSATTDHRHALRINTATTTDASLPFTVQYVRQQGVPMGGVQSGQIQAQATVTIDYQ